jgi:hypothetical protein
MCARCGIHPATVQKADSVLDWAHGCYDSMCLCCVIALDVREAERQAALLPKWRDELAAACQDLPPHDAQSLLTENARLRNEGRAQWLAAHSQICGQHYPGQDALNYAHPHPPGEHCYWPEPAV